MTNLIRLGITLFLGLVGSTLYGQSLMDAFAADLKNDKQTALTSAESWAYYLKTIHFPQMSPKPNVATMDSILLEEQKKLKTGYQKRITRLRRSFKGYGTMRVAGELKTSEQKYNNDEIKLVGYLVTLTDGESYPVIDVQVLEIKGKTSILQIGEHDLTVRKAAGNFRNLNKGLAIAIRDQESKARKEETNLYSKEPVYKLLQGDKVAPFPPEKKMESTQYFQSKATLTVDPAHTLVFNKSYMMNTGGLKAFLVRDIPLATLDREMKCLLAMLSEPVVVAKTDNNPVSYAVRLTSEMKGNKTNMEANGTHRVIEQELEFVPNKKGLTPIRAILVIQKTKEPDKFDMILELK